MEYAVADIGRALAPTNETAPAAGLAVAIECAVEETVFDGERAVRDGSHKTAMCAVAVNGGIDSDTAPTGVDGGIAIAIANQS